MGKLHILTLTKDQDVMDGIHEYLKDKAWKGAAIVGGVGSIYNVTVANPGTYEMPPKMLSKTVERPCEIVSFMGEIVRKEDVTGVPDHFKDTASDYIAHVHMAFSHDEGEVNGGGFRKATVLRAINVYMVEFD